MRLKLMEARELAQAYALARAFGIELGQEGRPLALAAWEDGARVGLCLGRLGRPGGAAQLEFLYVHGRSRGRGIARDLLKGFVQGARRARLEQVVAEYTVGGARPSPAPLLEALGFSGPRRGETLLSASLDDLAGSDRARPPAPEAIASFRRLSTLSPSEFARFRFDLERSAPRFATLSAVKGELLPELSWFQADARGDLRSSLLMADYGGALYFHSLYCAPGGNRGLADLLRQAVSDACALRDRYGRLYVTCINQAAYRIAMRVVEGIPYTEETAWRMYLPLT